MACCRRAAHRAAARAARRACDQRVRALYFKGSAGQHAQLHACHGSGLWDARLGGPARGAAACCDRAGFGLSRAWLRVRSRPSLLGAK
eukprot:1850991-Prymnesium_polylepis.2